LPVLIKSVRDLDGVKTKGIFRISASKDELVKLRKQIDGGENMDVKVDSPHIPAGMLKEWLRELSEPLIPTEVYPECVVAVKDMDKPAEDMSKEVMVIFEKLPDISKRVIKSLAVLLKDIAKENATNLMTIDNLAIVFAPSLLRCPSDDPMELLQNSKFETRFTSVLFKSLP